MDRDLNAARNILARGLDTLQPDFKRTPEDCKAVAAAGLMTA
jgi:transposase